MNPLFITKQTRVLCQGITGKNGTFHTQKALDYGTHMVGGVTPGKGGQTHLGLPVFNTVQQSKEAGPIDASVIYVPPAAATDAILEAIEAAIPLIVCITEGIPQHDMLLVKAALANSNSILLGPNCPGLIVPGQCKIGIMPGAIHRPGSVAVISRSGTLTYEAVHQLSALGLGQSICIGIGGDPLHGLAFTDLLPMLLADQKTDAILMIGEIGGHEEEDAAQLLEALKPQKPIFAFVAGSSAPPGKRMGHAGALLTSSAGTAACKKEALQKSGVHIIQEPWHLGQAIHAHLKKSA